MREIKFRASHGGYAYDVETIDKPVDGRGSHNFKGYEINGGYIFRKVKNHPLANSRGYYLEHRLILEEKMKRFLLPDEVVHHIDGDRKNNKVTNLKIITQSEHAGMHFVGKRNPNGTRVAAEPIFSEIKFRLNDKDRGITRTYTLAQLISTTFRRGQFEFRGRFTGLHDKNGKEIYESDLVGSHYKLGVVKWDAIEARFRVYCKEQLPMPANYPVTSDWEVIGNVYSNPELAGRTE